MEYRTTKINTKYIITRKDTKMLNRLIVLVEGIHEKNTKYTWDKIL